MALTQRLSVLVFLIAALGSCIEPLEIQNDEQQNILVVEGFINTQPGPYTIRISKSAKYGSVFEGVVRNEKNAVVRIRDESGAQVFLEETRPGTYETPDDFRGQVGSTYSLLITTLDDVNYISLPQAITPAPPIGSFVLRYKKITTGSNSFQSGVEVYSEWQDPGDEQNFYLWKSSGTYVINTRPDLFAVVDPNTGDLIPAPKDCCITCWVTERDADTGVRVFSDSRTNGNTNTELVAFINDDGARYTEKYQIRVEQHAISKEAFQFFALLKNQISINGDIFDPPPAVVRGNMLNLDDAEEPVIGFFYASDVAIDSVFIPGSVLGDTQPTLQINDDCRTLPNSTSARPFYW